MNCASCGCSPCTCSSPSFLNEPRIFDPVVSGGEFQGGTFQGPTIDGGTASGQQINGATIDCTTLGCTQPGGTCDGTLATTAFVCGAITDAISGANPDFCIAVNACLGIVGTLCDGVEVCINSTPGIISNPAAFDPSVYATDSVYGVVRFATLPELEAANCELAIDPCTLGAFWSAGGPNALWTAFEAAVNSAVMGGAIDFCVATAGCGYQAQATLCADVAACGFAPLNNPVFTGDPQAPTPAPGDNDTSVATTAFVTDAVSTAISALNPAFCAAVLGCGGGGGGGGGAGGDVYAWGAFDITEAAGLYSIMPIYATGLTIPPTAPAPLPYPYTVTILTPLPNDDYTVSMSFDNESAPGPASFPMPQLIQGTGTVDFEELPLPLPGQTLRVHIALLSKATSIPCTTLQASFTPVAGYLPPGARFLADDCNSYVPVGQVLARLKGYAVSGTAGGPVISTTVPVTTGCVAVIGPPDILTVSFSTLAPNANYSVVIGGGVTGSGGAPHDLVYPRVANASKTTAGFVLQFFETAAGGVAPPLVDFDFAVIG